MCVRLGPPQRLPSLVRLTEEPEVLIQHQATTLIERTSISTMVGPRRKHLAASKRRVDEEGEDEEGSVAAGVDDDSMSEASAISDADDDADAEGSEFSDMDIPESSNRPSKAAVNGRSKPHPDDHHPVEAAPQNSSFAVMTNDTAAMMNGLQLSQDMDEAEGINFDDLAKEGQDQAVENGPGSAPPLSHVASPVSNVVDKRRQEHEEYKRRRDADPSFVPNRGGFFMHDSRSAAPGRNGFRPFGSVRGRGRGRGTFGGPQSMARYEIHFLLLSPASNSLRAVKPLKHQALQMRLGHMISTIP